MSKPSPTSAAGPKLSQNEKLDAHWVKVADLEEQKRAVRDVRLIVSSLSLNPHADRSPQLKANLRMLRSALGYAKPEMTRTKQKQPQVELKKSSGEKKAGKGIEEDWELIGQDGEKVKEEEEDEEEDGDWEKITKEEADDEQERYGGRSGFKMGGISGGLQ